MKFRWIILLCLPFLLKAESSVTEWTLSVEKKGILVHKREVPGSNLLEFRVRAQVNAPLLHILSVLQDLSSFKEWDPHYKDLKILERKKDTECIYYYAVKAPWPLQDRDFVAFSKITIDEKNRALRMNDRETTHPLAPLHPDRVRMPLMRISWYFKPVAKGRHTLLELTVRSDPGGSLPDAVKNMAGSDSAFEMIDNLRNRVEGGKFDAAFVRQYAHFEKWH